MISITSNSVDRIVSLIVEAMVKFFAEFHPNRYVTREEIFEHYSRNVSAGKDNPFSDYPFKDLVPEASKEFHLVFPDFAMVRGRINKPEVEFWLERVAEGFPVDQLYIVSPFMHNTIRAAMFGCFGFEGVRDMNFCNEMSRTKYIKFWKIFRKGKDTYSQPALKCFGVLKTDSGFHVQQEWREKNPEQFFHLLDERKACVHSGQSSEPTANSSATASQTNVDAGAFESPEDVADNSEVERFKRAARGVKNICNAFLGRGALGKDSFISSGNADSLFKDRSGIPEINEIEGLVRELAEERDIWRTLTEEATAEIQKLRQENSELERRTILSAEATQALAEREQLKIQLSRAQECLKAMPTIPPGA